MYVCVCSGIVDSFCLTSSVLTLIPLFIQMVNKGADSQTEGEGGRPPMDLFKAIFASSSDEKSSSSEDEQGDSEDDQAGTREADSRSSQETDLAAASMAQGTSLFQTLWPKENDHVSREPAALCSV